MLPFKLTIVICNQRRRGSLLCAIELVLTLNGNNSRKQSIAQGDGEGFVHLLYAMQLYAVHGIHYTVEIGPRG